MDLFSGCVVHLLPHGRDMTATRRRILGEVIIHHGGKVLPVITAEATHVIASEHAPSDLLERAILRRKATVHIVSASWVSESVLKQSCLPEEQFTVLAQHSVSPALRANRSPPPQGVIRTQAANMRQASVPTTYANARKKTKVKSELGEDLGDSCDQLARKAAGSSAVAVSAAGASSGAMSGPDCDVNAAASESCKDHVIKGLEDLGEAYAAQGDRWRSWQLAKAARLIRSWCQPLRHPEDFDAIVGLGPRTREKCRELLRTGSLVRLQKLQADDMTQMLMEFRNIHGVGERVARQWYAAGCRSLADVRARKNDLGLSKFQLIGLKYAEEFQRKIARAEALQIVAEVLSAAERVFGDGTMSAHGCGSLRRGNKVEVSDVDIVLAPKMEHIVLHRGLGAVVQELHRRGSLTDDLCHYDPRAPAKKHTFELYLGVLQLAGGVHRRLDLVLSTYEHFPFVLLQWTGSGLFVRELHKLANARGFHLGPTGLWVGTGPHGQRVSCTDEEEIFEALGLPYRPPNKRELDSSFMQTMQAAQSWAVKREIKQELGVALGEDAKLGNATMAKVNKASIPIVDWLQQDFNHKKRTCNQVQCVEISDEEADGVCIQQPRVNVP
jgi:DNA polymerase/3'-5' exonuclease PolX